MNNPCHLENWGLVCVNHSHYLIGVVTGHPRIKDGEAITTSYIVGKVGSPKGDVYLSKTGRKYTIGEPDPAHEAQFPNAKERLSKAIPTQF